MSIIGECFVTSWGEKEPIPAKFGDNDDDITTSLASGDLGLVMLCVVMPPLYNALYMSAIVSLSSTSNHV